MLIRGQDKKRIVNFDNYNGVAIAYQSECDFNVCAVLEVDAEHVSHVMLGNYSTEEKAIKVLDMIQEEYAKHIYGVGGEMATRSLYIPPFGFIPPKVFLMPQDDDKLFEE